jgi:hypothetical protein
MATNSSVPVDDCPNASLCCNTKTSATTKRHSWLKANATRLIVTFVYESFWVQLRPLQRKWAYCNIFWTLLKRLNLVTSPVYFYKQLQHTFETSKTFETYACNIRFHRNISLLWSRVTAATALTVAVTFWCGTAASVAPRRARGTGHGAHGQWGHGAQRARAGAAWDAARC